VQNGEVAEKILKTLMSIDGRVKKIEKQLMKSDEKVADENEQ